MRRPAALLVALAVLAAAPPARANEIDDLWRAGIARTDEMLAHPGLDALLRRMLGARFAAFQALAVRPEPVARHAGRVVIGAACAAAGCDRGGVLVVADTARGVVQVHVAPASGPIETASSPDFPMASEPVQAAIAAWRRKHGR
jgi:hypothetical protein